MKSPAEMIDLIRAVLGEVQADRDAAMREQLAALTLRVEALEEREVEDVDDAEQA